MDRRPTFGDLYEKVDDKLDKLTERLSRLEKGLIVLTLLVMSPKFGGPDPSHLVATLVHWFA